MNNVFCFSSSCLLKNPWNKPHASLAYKETNMNEFFYLIKSKLFINWSVYLQAYNPNSLNKITYIAASMELSTIANFIITSRQNQS